MKSVRTKIIATLGPACEERDILTAMIRGGLNILRFNFSHTSFEQFENINRLVKKIAKEEKREVAIMVDLQDPRMRVGVLPHGAIDIVAGQLYNFCHDEICHLLTDAIPINEERLHFHIKVGEPFYLVNGAIEMAVEEVRNGVIVARAKSGGHLTSGRAINVPKTNLGSDSLTKKDLGDLQFALQHGVEYLALSFVQSSADVERVRQLIGASTKHHPQIISKIERQSALEDIDGIIKLSDGIMIARGDLGIEMPLEKLPIIQKNLVRHAHWHEKPAIIATEMMTSMISQARPTRAEASDIANAVFDGADALMLSDETAIGQHPAAVIVMMQKIVVQAESYLYNHNFFDNPENLI